ncbi:MAG: zinc-ribbon domain-containing protein, partial [Acidimicrobiales bacterium]
MIVCTNCGHENEGGDTFCGSCGAFLEFSGTAADGAGEADDPGYAEAVAAESAAAEVAAVEEARRASEVAAAAEEEAHRRAEAEARAQALAREEADARARADAEAAERVQAEARVDVGADDPAVGGDGEEALGRGADPPTDTEQEHYT